jgi:L-fuconolactonase
MGRDQVRLLLSDLVEKAMQEWIDAELTAAIGAGHELTETLTKQRNKGRPRVLSTPAGDVELWISRSTEPPRANAHAPDFRSGGELISSTRNLQVGQGEHAIHRYDGEEVRVAMKTIDAHQHFWKLSSTTHSWPERAKDLLLRDFQPDDLMPELRSVGVDQTILIQSVDTEQETASILAVAASTEFIAGAVGWIPLRGTEAAAKALEQIGDNRLLVGVRHLINFEPDPNWLGRADVIDGISVLADRGLAFEVVPVIAEHRDHLLTVAARYPDLNIVIDHLGNPPVMGGSWDAWSKFIGEAAEHPNVAIKLSAGLDVVVDWPEWSADSLQPYVDRVLDAFSPSRVMFASNWPVVLLAGDYRRMWTGTNETISNLSANERADVLGGTAERWYRIDAESAARDVSATHEGQL